MIHSRAEVSTLYAGRKAGLPAARQASPLGTALRSGYGLIAAAALMGLFLGTLRSDIGSWFHPYRWYFLGVLVWGAVLILARSTRFRQTAEHRCLYVLMAVSAASCFVSPEPEYSFARLASFVLMFLGVFVGAWMWVRRPENVLFAVHVLLLMIVVAAAVSALYLAQEPLWGRGERATGAFGKATGAGSFTAAALPILLWKWRYTRGWRHGVLTLCLATLGYLLIFSGARAAILASLGTTTLWSWKHYPRARCVLVALVLLVSVGLSSGFLSLDMLPSYVVREETIPTLTGRLPLWKTGLQIFVGSPMIGSGYGIARHATLVMDEKALQVYLGDNPKPKTERFVRRAVAERRAGKMTFHSDHVERLLETGIVGYAPFAIFWVLLLRRLWRLVRQPLTPMTSLGISLGLNVMYVLVDSFMHGAMFAIGNAPTTITWLGIVLFMAASEHSRTPARR